MVTPAQLETILARLRSARAEVLERIPVAAIVDALARVAALWRDPGYRLRIKAEELLPELTGYSRPMIARCLEATLGSFRKEVLEAQLASELGDPRCLDEFRPRRGARGLSKALGPEVVTHVLAGNVPGLAAITLVRALLVKAASVGKVASEEPLTAELFVESLAEVSPELARCIAIVQWKGGSADVERVAFDGSDVVVALGSDETIARIQEQVRPPTRLVGYGHKVSFEVVGRELLSGDATIRAAQAVARDVSMFDQQGCVSSHVVYVEAGGARSPREFARTLAAEMAAFQREVPRGKISLGESAAIRSLRAISEARELRDDDVELHQSPSGTDWTVVFDGDPTFQPSCLNRAVRVSPIDDARELPRLVAPIRRYLQTVGAGLPRDRKLALAESLGRLGAVRICPLGAMPEPPLWWHHDGRGNLQELVRWVDVEDES